MVTAKEIPPGGVGEVKITFRSKGYQGKTKKAVTVETDDPDNQRVRLSVSGEVVSEVTVQPRYRGQSREARLSFSVRGAAREQVVDLAHVAGSRTKIARSSSNNSRPKEPAYRIVKPDGELVATGKFEYG